MVDDIDALRRDLQKYVWSQGGQREAALVR
jgi:hypothetical protein